MPHALSRNFAFATQRQVAKTESYGAFVAIDGFERHGLVNIGQASAMQQAKLNTAALLPNSSLPTHSSRRPITHLIVQ